MINKREKKDSSYFNRSVQLLLIALMIGSIGLFSLPAKVSAQVFSDPDINNDSVVNILDVSLVAISIGLDPDSDQTCQDADIDNDGDIDTDDLNFVIASFGQPGSPILESDTTAPVIANVNPPDGFTTSDALPTISATYSDTESGINIDSVILTLDGNDITILGDVTATSVSYTPVSAIADGLHNASFEVSDLAGNKSVTQTTFNVPAPNTDVVTLDPIGDKSVDLGASLSFTVSATGTNPDNITLGIKPLPLPSNAQFDSSTGTFRFTPDASQGDSSFQLTFFADDGPLLDSETITVTVNKPAQNEGTALKGQLLDANDVEQGIITPIVGAVVRNIETGKSTLTDSNGNFLLTGLFPGVQHFDYDGSGVTAPDGSVYGAYRGQYDLIADVVNIIERPIYIMRIDILGTVQVDPSQTTMLENPALQVTIEILPFTVKDEFGNDYTGTISISEVPSGFTPSAMPSDLNPGVVYTIQPMGLTFTQPAPITFPNVYLQDPGEVVNIWSLNHKTGKFFVTGKGEVSADGENINTINGGIRATSWWFGAPSLPSFDEDNDKCGENEDNDREQDCPTGSGFHARTGNFHDEHTLSSYRSQGKDRFLTFNYNSTSAYPNEILATTSSARGFSIFTAYDLFVGGAKIGDTLYKRQGGRVVKMFDATNYETGNYSYKLKLTNYGWPRPPRCRWAWDNILLKFRWFCPLPPAPPWSIGQLSSFSGSDRGNVIVNNQVNSHFGSGWTLNELSRLHIQEDESHLLIEGDGSAKKFSGRAKTINITNALNAFNEVDELPQFFAFSVVAVDDFNKDGIQDLVTASFDNTVSIVIGDGTSSFSDANTFVTIPDSTNTSVQGVATGDFNNDENQDLAVRYFNNNIVSILLGDGTGSFGNATNINVGEEVGSVSVGDFNGDSNNDLALVNSFGGLSILLGDGTGSFSTSTTSSNLGLFGTELSIGDFNSDGNIDIAGAGFFGLSVFLGDGTGSFAAPTVYSTGGFGTSVAMDDFDGDGNLDLIVAIRNSNVSIHFGDGTGIFSAGVTLAVGNVFTNVATANEFAFVATVVTGDLNSDGNRDFVVTNHQSNFVTIYHGDGTGSFASPLNVNVRDVIFGVNINDFDNDGIQDVGLRSAAGFVILPRDSNGSFIDIPLFRLNVSTDLTIALADFNKDGNNDIAISGRFSNDSNTQVTTNGGVAILLGDGSGSFDSLTKFNAGNEPAFVATADFDKDSNPDLVVANREGNNVSILSGDGTGFFSDPTDFSTGSVPVSVAVNDTDNDGNLDLVVANSADNNISVLLGDGTGFFSDPIDFSTGIEPVSVAVNDINNDSNQDIVVANRGGHDVSVLLGDGTGFFNDLINFSTGGFFPESIIVKDINDDGNQDIVVANSGGNDVSILLGDGTGSFSNPINFNAGGVPISVTVNDITNDGNQDIIVATSGGNVSILLGDGTGFFSNPLNINGDGDGLQDIAVVDFNGDGLQDIAVVDSSSLNIITGNSTVDSSSVFLYKSPDGDTSKLIENLNGSFIRILTDGTNINYDSQGFQTSVVDRNGNTTLYEYSNGLLVSITDPVGLVQTLAYSGGLVSTATDPAGRVTHFVHDGMGNLTTIIDTDGAEHAYGYDSRHLMTSITDPNGNTEAINYNFAGRVESVQLANGFDTWKSSPSIMVGLVDPSSGVGIIDTSSITDPPNNLAPSVPPSNVNTEVIRPGNTSVQFKTDRFGAPLSIVDPLNNATIIKRDENSNPTSMELPNGVILKSVYDSRGNLVKLTNEDTGAITQMTYRKEFNNVTSIIDPNENKTVFDYDGKGNLIKVIDALNNETTFTYNDQGLLIDVTNAMDNTLTFTYDANGNVTTTTDPLNNITTFTYDAAGNVVKTTDANGEITQFLYDLMNRLTKTTDANGNAGLYSYDANGNLKQVTDANGNITTYAYDEFDRVVSATDPLGNAETFVYDAAGNLITKTDRNGKIINYEYNALDRLIKKVLPGNFVAAYDYDAVGNLVSVSDHDSNLAFTYDGDDRLTSAATTGSPNQPDVTIDYTYDKNGNRLTMADSNTGGTTNYVYDELNRVTNITNPASESISFGYDVLSRRVSTTLPNSVVADYTYDANSWLANLDHKLGTATLSSFGYIYDNVGNRISMNTIRTGVTVNNNINYEYDNIYQLTQATRPLPSLPDETFNYGPLGNRLSRDGQTTNSTIGAANRLFDDTKFTYTYDNNGNLIQEVDTRTNATTAYTYNVENQLLRIDLPNGSVAQYRYDVFGRRVEKDIDGNITRYIYDNEDIVLEFDDSVQVASYTHGPGIDDPLIMKRVGQSLFYQTDGLRSIVNLTDESGTVVQWYVYDSFGNIEQQIGTLANPYTYTGREVDTESGLYYYRARYYDAATGRFINEDPIGFSGGDLNLYRYVQNNAVNWVDPSGLLIVDLIGSEAVADVIQPLLPDVLSPGVKRVFSSGIAGGIVGGIGGFTAAGLPTAGFGAPIGAVIGGAIGIIDGFVTSTLLEAFGIGEAFDKFKDEHIYSLPETLKNRTEKVFEDEIIPVIDSINNGHL